MKVSTILGCAALLVIGAITWWFLTNFDHIEQPVYQGLQGEARDDVYLAMKRFLIKEGVQVDERKPSTTGSAKFAGWPAGGTVMLGDRRHVGMTPERVRQTLEWVDAGGHLILEAEFPGRPDPLLAALDLDRRQQTRNFNNAPTRKMTPAERTAAWLNQNLTDVVLPGNPRVYKVQFSPYQSLADPKNHAAWKVENEQGLRMVHLKRGAGQITVVSNFDWLGYSGTMGIKRETYQPTNIGKFDHAELLMALLRLNPNYARQPLRLIWSNDEISLWDKLLTEAWMALAALAALVLMWLWRVIPRFGPLEPEPPPAEQRLAAHLEASGRFFWKYLSPHVVYLKLRDAFERRLAERRPGLAALRPAERAKELARLINVNASAVAQALDAPVQSATEFVRNVRVLQRLLEKI